MAWIPYTTTDEINYIDGLARKNPAGAVKYCQMVLRTDRRWDPSVDVDAVRAHCLKVIQMLELEAHIGDGPHL
jgi:hypothetical protein